MRFAVDLNKGILGGPDSTEMWEDIISHIPDELLLKPNLRILNIACGHGTEAVLLAKRMLSLGISKEKVNNSLFLLDKYRVFTNHAKTVYGFENTITEDFLEWKTDMNFDLVIGNPPYNDGTSANNPIYQLFTKKVAEKMMPEYFCFVIQANWLTQTRGVGKVMRDALKKAGVYNITINGWDAFEHAKVRTCTVFCKKGYTGSITLSDRNKSVVISNFDEKILLIADATELMLLNKLKPSKEKKHNLKGISDKWGIGTSYKKEGFDIDPLNTLKIIPPNKTGYKLFATFDTENEAVSNKEKYSSFWRSKLVTYILLRTRTSTTLDNPQIEYVPNLFIDRIFTDTELYQIYNLSNAEITHIESHVKHLY